MSRDIYFDAEGGEDNDYTVFSKSVQMSILRATLGEKLGEGVSRAVYALRGTKDLVVKVENRSGSFCNAMEWEVWSAVQYHENARWFAPCFGIDPFGVTLVQARTTPVPGKKWDALPELPWFFTDIKQENFGMFEGRIVCHDYGYHNLINHGVCSKRMQKKKW